MKSKIIKNLNKVFINTKINERLLSQVFNSIMKNNRKGLSKQKTRGEVNFSNKKPWKQKGTGSARAGRKSSPLWIKGGRAFSNEKNNYKNKINYKTLKKFRIMLIINTIRKKNIFFLKKYKNIKDYLKKKERFLLIIDIKEDYSIFLKYRNFKKFIFSGLNFDVKKLMKCENILVKKKYLNLII